MAETKLDILHRAMGEFLTASSQLENILAALLVVCDQGKIPIEQTWGGFLHLTFGQRVNFLIEKCATETFNDEHRTILDKEFARLKDLVPNRNLIVHGTTFFFNFEGGDAVVPFRVGSAKNNLQFLQQFIDSKGECAHSFTAERVQELTATCHDIHNRIGKVVMEVMTERSKLESDKSP